MLNNRLVKHMANRISQLDGRHKALSLFATTRYCWPASTWTDEANNMPRDVQSDHL